MEDLSFTFIATQSCWWLTWKSLHVLPTRLHTSDLVASTIHCWTPSPAGFQARQAYRLDSVQSRTLKMILISHTLETSTEVRLLCQALKRQGFSCTATATYADTVLLYLSPAYIHPHSAAIAEARLFLRDQTKLVIAIFARVSVHEVRNLMQQPGWDEDGVLFRLVSNMGIDMKHRKLDIEGVAHIVKDQVTASKLPKAFDIFLSHAGEDKDFIRLLRNVLGRQYRCFLDEDSLSAGSTQRPGDQQLLTAAGTSKLGIFVLSERSIRKRWPLKEVQIFRQQRVPIVVVWYKFQWEQAEEYLRVPGLLPCRGSMEFLQAVLHDHHVHSIHYTGRHSWSDQEFALHVKRNIDNIFLGI